MSVLADFAGRDPACLQEIKTDQGGTPDSAVAKGETRDPLKVRRRLAGQTLFRRRICISVLSVLAALTYDIRGASAQKWSYPITWVARLASDSASTGADL